jgi:hypothetical protein
MTEAGDSMIRSFLDQHASPGGRVPLVRLYEAFKQTPKTEGCRYLYFLNELIRAGASLKQERGRLYVLNVAL